MQVFYVVVSHIDTAVGKLIGQGEEGHITKEMSSVASLSPTGKELELRRVKIVQQLHKFE